MPRNSLNHLRLRSSDEYLELFSGGLFLLFESIFKPAFSLSKEVDFSDHERNKVCSLKMF
jgi:hypothetical protein